MYRRITFALSAVVILCRCAWMAPATSLSPEVIESADQYSQVMDEFSNRVLLANVLRARDNLPLNFNDLSTLNGSFSVSGSLGLTIPFGPKSRLTSQPYSASPMISGSSSPTLTMSTLNTQGFILTMIQPISPTYVLSKWNEGYDHELLLYLFVKSIRFCDDRNQNDPSQAPDCYDPLRQALDYAQKAAGPLIDRSPNFLDQEATVDPDSFEKYVGSILAAVNAINIVRNQFARKPILKAILDQAYDEANKAYESAAAPDANSTTVVSLGISEAAADTKRALEVRSSSSTCEPLETRRVHENNPDNKEAMADFRRLVNCLADERTADGGDVDLKALTILDPLGNPLPYGETFSVVTPPAQTQGQGGNPQPPSTPMADAFNVAPVPSTCQSPVATDPRYWVSVTYVQGTVESLASPEKQLQLPTACRLQVDASHGYTQGQTPDHYNVYVRTAQGMGTKQNGLPVSRMDAWIEPTTGFWLWPSSTLLAPSSSQYARTTPGSQNTVAADISVITTINGLSDGQLHVGNAACPGFLSEAHQCAAPDNSPAPYIQLYKEYPAQVVLCVNAINDEFDGHVITPVPLSDLDLEASTSPEAVELRAKWKQIPASHHADKLRAARRLRARILSDVTSGRRKNETKAGSSLFRMLAAKPTGAGSGSGNAAGTNTGGGGAGGPGGGGAPAGGTGTGNTAGAMPAVTLALVPNRVSAIVDNRFCTRDQIVLKSSTDEQFDVQTSGFAHIEWRSIAEVIRYLGAIARNQDDGQVPSWPLGTNTQQLFTVLPGDRGDLSVRFHGARYSVPDEPAGSTDHSLQALALLNELISLAKISSNLPVTQPVEVLP